MRINKKLAAAAVAAVTLAGTGVAWAWWSAPGDGTANDTAASSNGTVVYHVAFDAANLAPGTTVPITYTATTTGPTDLQVTAPVATVSSDVPACTAWLHVGQPTQTATTVPHGVTATAMGSGVITFDNSSADQNACKGQTVTVSVSSS